MSYLDCSAKCPSVPEEYIPDDIFRGRGVGLEVVAVQQLPPDSPLPYTATIFAHPEVDTNFQTSGPSDFQQGTFVIYVTGK